MLCESLMILVVEESKIETAGAIGEVTDVKRKIARTTESVVISLKPIALLKVIA